MNDRWDVTPSLSPDHKVTNAENFDDGSSESFNIFNDWDLRIFHCMGEVHGSHISYHENSYLMKNDLSVFTVDENEYFFLNDFGGVSLFGFSFDKGSALMLNISHLFKMAKQTYMQLESIATSNMNTFGLTLSNRKSCSHLLCREEIVNFMIYLRNYISRVGLCSKHKWMAEEFFTKLHNELESFISLVGSITCLPDYVINYSASSAGNKCTQPSYHVYHCQLDLKWLYITLLYQLILYKQRLKANVVSQENDSYLTFENLETSIRNTISDLIIISLKRFQQISSQDVVTKSMFTCTCTRELWRMLQVCSDDLHSKHGSRDFWQLLNDVCDQILKKPDDEQNPKFTCSSPSVFCLWTLKHLGKLYMSDPKRPLKSNHPILENCLKLTLSSDVTESQMRILLILVESILTIGWEERTECVILFWEYFHKRLNSSFYMNGGPITELAVTSKSALGLITHLSNKLDCQTEKNLNSFHLYLRLLRHKLKIWSENVENQRCWNQLKGRILCKFSPSKLSTLNETGLYHFVSLFLVLAMAADLQEMSTKLQMFLKLLPVQDLDEGRLKLIWKAHMALILLFAERNQNISLVSPSLLDMVDVAVQQPESFDLMRIFSEGFQDLVDCTNNLELGQYMLIGNWMQKYLSHCTESDASQLLDSLLSLISKLISIITAQLPVSQDSQLILLQNSLWENLVPYLKNSSSNPSSPYQVSDIAVMLTSLSLNACFLPSVKMKAVDLFNFFVVNDRTDINVLIRYLGQISRTVDLRNAFGNNQILLIKGWLRCLLLSSNTEAHNDDLSTFTNCIVSIPEIQQLLSETSVKLSPDTDHFETFLIALQLKYSSLNDLHLRNKFVNQVTSYFTQADRWISHIINDPKSAQSVLIIYQNVGQIFHKIPNILYVKSKSNTLLQVFLDLLLLPIQVRNPQYKLSPYVTEAIKKTLHQYVHGLFKLVSENDNYISRCIRELITLYIPRLVTPKGSILAHCNSQISLSKCFEQSDCFEPMSKGIIEILCSSFLKRKTKTPQQFAYHALTFLHNIIRCYSKDIRVVKCFIENAFERLCDVEMFCDPISACKTEARDTVYFILNLNSLREDEELGSVVMEVFSRLCHEHLAFTSRNVFDFFESIVHVAPDLVLRFIPQFEKQVKEVETKRGRGHDQVLRKGLERIGDALKNIKESQASESIL